MRYANNSDSYIVCVPSVKPQQRIVTWAFYIFQIKMIRGFSCLNFGRLHRAVLQYTANVIDNSILFFGRRRSIMLFTFPMQYDEFTYSLHLRAHSIPFRRRKNINFFSKISSVNINKWNHLGGIEREGQKRYTHCECHSSLWMRHRMCRSMEPSNRRWRRRQIKMFTEWELNEHKNLQRKNMNSRSVCRLPGCRFWLFGSHQFTFHYMFSNYAYK